MSETARTAAEQDSSATHFLDLRGHTCPTTSDETLRVLETLSPGEVLEVQSDYYPARSTIPYHCDKRGYRYTLLDSVPQGPEWRIRIEKR